MRRQGGFTLVELLVTLAVIGVLVGVVFPGFRGLIDRNSLTTTTNSLVLAISYARSESVRSGEFARVRHRGAGWADGWEVVTRDPLTGNDVVERIFDPVPDALTIAASPSITQLRFNNQGLLADATEQTFTLCLPGDRGIRVRVAATGRHSTSEADDDC